jgi:predicted PurR-regulated permease PerM
MQDRIQGGSDQAPGLVRVASGLFVLSFVLGILYLGRQVLEPLAIAVLLAFVLTPPIRRLRRWNVGRAASVILVVALAVGIIGALGFVMETQVSHLAGEVPKYQENLRAKIASLNRALVPSGTLSRASSTLDSLASELNNKDGAPNGTAPRALAPDKQATPIPVEVRKSQPATLDYIQELLSPLIEPLTMGGLLILFLIFILFYREDLRDRILRLAGARDLQKTTEAMDEAGKRLSRYFLIQAAINASFGVVIGAALWIIGVPNSVLWGMLAAILRWVPYVGTPIAAIFPLALASAIDPGWSKVIATALVFLAAEVMTGQAIEPVLQGQQTGLSPVAIVLAQLFWTLIWGVPGLLLAVPITACIAVLGRHVETLNFLGVVLGDEPALAPHEGFYQRILAGDAIEAAYQAESLLAEQPLTEYYDAVAMKALALAHADAARGRLSEEKQLDLVSMIQEVIEDLEDYSDVKADIEVEGGGADGGKTPGAATMVLPSKGPSPLLLVAARTLVDQAASLLLADILTKRGLKLSVQPYAQRRHGAVSNTKLTPKIVAISCFGGSEAASALRFIVRRHRRVYSGAQFLACFWGLDDSSQALEELRQTVGADFAVGSLKKAALICGQETGEKAAELRIAPSPQAASRAS